MKRVRRSVPILLLSILAGCLVIFCGRDEELKGRLETKSGQSVLTVWGSHYEMGYAQGYLLGRNFLEMFDYYLLDHFGGGENYEVNVRPYVTDHCVDPNQTPYGEELAGLLDGWRQVCADSGWSTVSEFLGREVDINDLYTAQFVPDFFWLDLGSIQCSSLSAWGDATKSDPQLAGGLVYCRILDWTTDELLIDNTVIVIYQPEDDSETGWVSFAYPFFIGCLSGISEDGVCASYNLGNHNEPADESGKFWPILWSIRQGIENADYNGGGTHDSKDIYAAIADHPRTGTHIIHCASPALGSNAVLPCVVEANNAGIAIRYPSDEPDIAPDHLIATNHHCKLYEPAYCYRYSRLLNALIENPAVTTQRAWQLEDSVSTFISVMKILIRSDNRDFWFAYGDALWDPLEGAVYYKLDELF
jgi:hypothetical protein